MIQVEDLSLSYQGDSILEGVSFSLQKGERCGFVGRNGSGKTSLFRLLAGREEPDSGRIFFPKGYRLGFLDQHIRFSKPSVIEEAGQGLQEEELHRAHALLAGLGFNEAQLESAPSQLSGGFQLRLQLAKVLLAEPDCLLLDEPTNYLDILSVRFLIRFLQRWRGEMVLISHDREFLDQIATHTMGLHRKKMIKVKGTTADYYAQIVYQEEIHERTRVKIEKTRSHAQAFIERFGAKATKAAQAQSRQKMLNRLPQLEQLAALLHLDFSFQQAPFPGKKMIEAHHLRFSYGAPLIEDFSLTVEKGQKIALIGKNGCGKSTLLRLLAQDLAAQGGTIKWRDGIRMGYFGQTNIDRLHASLTIEEEVAAANRDLNGTQVRGLCGIMLFSGDQAKKKISALSGGEKSRVLLAKILAHPCNLLLLDEPTHHLDVESVEALIDAIELFNGSCLIVTHSELILQRLNFDKLIICHEGGKQQLFLGNYAEFLEKGGWEEESPHKTSSKPAGSRRERAEKVNARSRALKPVQDKINRSEEAIGELEKLIDQNQQILNGVLPSQERQEKLKELAGLHQRCEQLYLELEKLWIEREKIQQLHQ